MKKKLFIFDLDGTALIPGKEPYARLPDFFSEFLDVISQKGWMWGINSTWDINGQWHLVLVSSVKSRPSFLIGEMGLRIAKVENCQLELLQPYTEAMEKGTKDIVEKNLWPVMNLICSRFHPSRMYFYGHLFDFMVDEKERKEFDKSTAEINNGELVIKRNEGRFVAYPSILNKGKPIKEIMRITGLSPEEIVVAGDEVIDIAMMSPSISKNPICPSNACDEVKEYIKRAGGVISEKPYGEGVIEAFQSLSM
ncbi:MAG TPA: HAD hydrolase family protein [bacterium]|nr:HAD hydrolase family protein [bacterium]